MSREGGQNQIDNIRSSLSTNHYERTALGNAVRYNTMLNILSQAEEDLTQSGTSNIYDPVRGFGPNAREEFRSALDQEVREITDEFNESVRDFEDLGENPSQLNNFERDPSLQESLGDRIYRTRLGRTIAKATTYGNAKYLDTNSNFRTGASGAFSRLTSGFITDDVFGEDFFGSRALYDNVFGYFEDGTEALSNRQRLIDSEDDTKTAVARALEDIAVRGVSDQTDMVNRVDIEFARFHGDSLIDQLSMTGSGLRAARETIRGALITGSAYQRQVVARGEDDTPQALADALNRRLEDSGSSTGQLKTALTMIGNNLKNRSDTTSDENAGFVTKAGVAEFIDLLNTAKNKISISTFQFQNETISAALGDVVQRRVLENLVRSASGQEIQPLQLDLILAYPRNRTNDTTLEAAKKFSVGQTGFSILGPNLIEALKLQRIKEQLVETLQSVGVAEDDIDQYLQVNVQFRDKKFHPKVYLTDNVAGIGTQNLTGPVGNSVNQAGSNFEAMRFFTNKYRDDTQLAQARVGFKPLTNYEAKEQADNYIKNNEITQSLMYWQIYQAVEYEKNFSSQDLLDRKGGGTAAPILNNRRGQIGFAGDIYQHLKSTLNYAYEQNFSQKSGSTSSNIYQNVIGKQSTHMFMILDQAFILQYGSTNFTKQLKGEMDTEIDSPFAEIDPAVSQYREQQSKLFDLLIAGKANVVVDAKNYREQIMNPLIAKIERVVKEGGNPNLKTNFERYGKSLGLMAGYALFNPSAAATPEEYTKSMQAMFSQLRALGFTKESGFEETDLKQIVGLASGNIEMAKAPRQHVKSYGLMDYRSGSPELISYYMGASNLGLYSLGIPTGAAEGYRSTDGRLTNTEMGIMLGRRDLDTNLSRTTTHAARMAEGHMNNPINPSNIHPHIYDKDYSLQQEEERYELMLSQRHLIHTWSQLGNQSITNPIHKEVKTTPLWQNNINTGDLIILKNRLETLAADLGVKSSAFKIVERYGDTSGSGLTSINVTIDIAQMLGTSGFMDASSKLPKLNFELTVLQGPSRGSSLLNNRTNDGAVPGFVYFVDKNKIVGNGIFSNDSGSAISVLGRKDYDDPFKASMIDGEGRVTIESGEKAHLSSLDMVPQLFATLIGEGMQRFGAGASFRNYQQLNAPERKDVLTEYLSTVLTGRGSMMNASINEYTKNNIISARNLLQQNLNMTNLQDVISGVIRHTLSDEMISDSGLYENRDEVQARANLKELKIELENFSSLANQLVNNRSLSDDTIDTLLNGLNNLVEKSPQLANVIMKSIDYDPNKAKSLKAFKDYQTLLFGSFLQSRDERTYGGQQGFYRTLLLGLGNSTIDQNTVGLLGEVDPQNPGLHNVGGYARFLPLDYGPTTDIHEYLYRSVASKSTSMSKLDSDIDSIMFEQEARDLGDATNLRLMSSIGIGNILKRSDFVIKDTNGNIQVSIQQQQVFDEMEKWGADKNAIALAKAAYIKSLTEHTRDDQNNIIQRAAFGEGNNTALGFYTGSTKKLAQLPQRIKNAMGSRPMYMYSVEAQQALADGEQLSQVTKQYLDKYRNPLITNARDKALKLIEKRDDTIKNLGADHEDVITLTREIENLNSLVTRAMNDQIAGLGAIFSGRIKSVLNQEQTDFILGIKKRLKETIGDIVEEDVFNEILRVEILKAGLVSKGLGKMIAGSNHMNYSMAMIQLSGTYTDTFLANPLYGSVYEYGGKYGDYYYNEIRNKDLDIYKLTDVQARKQAGVLNVGMVEGYYETQQKSIKGSMMGPGGMEILLENDDIIVEDPKSGKFVQKRKIKGKWVIVNTVDDKRNLQSIRNVIDNTSFSALGTPTLGTQPTTTYGRRGEDSFDYIYDVNLRAGNFQNNEYLINFHRLRGVRAGSGRRVEGTDSSSLIKGVANFAGRISTRDIQNNVLVEREMNLFEHLEKQILDSYEQGTQIGQQTSDGSQYVGVGGSLKAYLDYKEHTQKVKLEDRLGYSPLSSSIHGLYNSNNFKSFFWSHGATILRSTAPNDQGIPTHFMLNELFDTKQNMSISNAKKLAGALVLNFGTDFITSNQGDAATVAFELRDIKRALVEGMMKGEYGDYYQRLAMTTAIQQSSKINEAFGNNSRGIHGNTLAEVMQDVVADEIINKHNFADTQLGSLRGITSTQLLEALSGQNVGVAEQFLRQVRKGIIDPVAKKAASLGGITFDSTIDRQAVLVTTAVDLMHQISRSGSRLRIPSEIDFTSEKVQEILLNIIAAGDLYEQPGGNKLEEDLMQFINGLGTDISAVTVFTDITFSLSKDPTGTQSVGRHEGQHLITPFLGDIDKYRQKGQLDKIQHTIANLTALLTGTKSGLTVYDRMAKTAFKEQRALDLTSEQADYYFSSFHKQKFLGFYQSGIVGAYSDNYVKAYKQINKGIIHGFYEWDSIYVGRDEHGRVVSGINLHFDAAYTMVESYVNKFYEGADPLEKRRAIDKYLAMGGQGFAEAQMHDLVGLMMQRNNQFQSDPRKTIGKETTKQFLQNMNNRKMFISIPSIRFEQQYGQVVAQTNNNNSISTIIPSAEEMRVLGAQYADFVDPVLNHYKALTSIFVPGTLANTTFEKVRLAARHNSAIVLTTAEAKSLEEIVNAANLMPVEIEKAVAGARTQEAFAGKNKYQGFTATGIGSLLMPFGKVALSQSKLTEAGMRENKERIKLLKSTNEKIFNLLHQDVIQSDVGQMYLDMDDAFNAVHNSLKGTDAYKNKVKFDKIGTLYDSLNELKRLRKIGYAADILNVSKHSQMTNIVASLNQMERLYDQLTQMQQAGTDNSIKSDELNRLRKTLNIHKKELLDFSEKTFGLKSRHNRIINPLMPRELIAIDPKNDIAYHIVGQEGKSIKVFGAVNLDTGEEYAPGDIRDLSSSVHIEIRNQLTEGYYYYDADDNEVVLQKISVHAKYGNDTAPDYRILNPKARPLDLGRSKYGAPLLQTSKVVRLESQVLNELEGDPIVSPYIIGGTFGPPVSKKKTKQEKNIDDTQNIIPSANNRDKLPQPKTTQIEQELLTNARERPTLVTGKRQEPSSMRTVNKIWKNRYTGAIWALAQERKRKGLYTSEDILTNHFVNFYRKQKAAIAHGIAKAEEDEYKDMKRDAIKMKEKILTFQMSQALPLAKKQKAYLKVKEELSKKRDIAYQKAAIDQKTGLSITDDPNLPGKKGTLADSYIYHAQALNYDAMLAELLLFANAANVDQLSKEHVKELERKAQSFGALEFVLNTREYPGGLKTFAGLGESPHVVNDHALFFTTFMDEDSGTANRHMEAIKSLNKDMKRMGVKTSQGAKSQYAIGQINQTIEFYRKKLRDMDDFTAQREMHNKTKGPLGEATMDAGTADKMDAASLEYKENIRKIIDILHIKRTQIQAAKGTKLGFSDQEFRTAFEDIDIAVAEFDKANLELAEVFRPPTPGGTDPRLHTYQIMHGVQALNRVSNFISDLRGKKYQGQNRGMVYSTERGATGTFLAALGIVTYGGGDFDGDSYTTIFHQRTKLQQDIENRRSKIGHLELVLKGQEDRIKEMETSLSKLDAKNPKHTKKIAGLQKAIISAKQRMQEYKKDINSNDQALQNSINTFEKQVNEGKDNLNARARKQVANYLGMDERFFVKKGEIMKDAYGRVMKDKNNRPIEGTNHSTYDADALFVFMEQGYGLIEGLDSKANTIMTLMHNIDLLTGYRTEGLQFFDQLIGGLRTPQDSSITIHSPSVRLLRDRVNRLARNTSNLTEQQQQFLKTLADSNDETYVAYLQQFDMMNKNMERELAIDQLARGQEAHAANRDANRRAFMNQWVGGKLYGSIMENETLQKFMKQGVGMSLTEGTFDMALKTLGKAGGEVLGKTYNTIIGTTFQDAPIISYGRQILDESSQLHTDIKEHFAETAVTTDIDEKIKEELIQQGITKDSSQWDAAYQTKRQEVIDDSFQDYVEATRKAVHKSENVQGFMKNIHQLLRDSIKLKGGKDDLVQVLQEKADQYDALSRKIADNERIGDISENPDLMAERDALINSMASQLGPGPGLKSLMDLDYLTNQSLSKGMTLTDFETRFFGKIGTRRNKFDEFVASMGNNLTDDERRSLGSDPSNINGESVALMKMARTMTARNISTMVTSYHMSKAAGAGRKNEAKNWARQHKERIATQIEAGDIKFMPKNRTANGKIDFDAGASEYIRDKYQEVLIKDHNGARFDANRQHREALMAHLELEETHRYNPDGTLSKQYTNALTSAAKESNMSPDEYLLLFDHLYERNRDQIGGLFGKDGEKMEQFTVMNLMRKNLAQAQMTGKKPSLAAFEVMREHAGTEMLTTMAQLASQQKLNKEGMDIFAAMYRGVMSSVIEASGGEVITVDKSGKEQRISIESMTDKQKTAYMNKLIHQQMLGTEAPDGMGFNRATSPEAREFKEATAAQFRISVDEIDDQGRYVGNKLVDAFDKAGVNTLTGQQMEMYEAMGTAYLTSAIDNEEEFNKILKDFLPKGMSQTSKAANEYRNRIRENVAAQARRQQRKAANQRRDARQEYMETQRVLNRSSFFNKIDSHILADLASNKGANMLDILAPLALTAIGSVISEGNVDAEQLQALGGAAFTSFQYARTGFIDEDAADIGQYKRRLASAQVMSGIYKFKNALAQHGDKNIMGAVAQLAVQEVTSTAFNMIATPWISNKIVTKGLGFKAQPALSALDMDKYAAGQQLAGNIGASLISAVVSTSISGLIMKTAGAATNNLGEIIQSFMPAAHAVNHVNESIARRRAQEAAYQEFAAQTDNSESDVQTYMVLTDATYNPDDYSSIMDLQGAEIDPSNDGSLSVTVLV